MRTAPARAAGRGGRRNYSGPKPLSLTGTMSRESALIANWIDGFGPIVLEDFRAGKEWPEVVILDGQPIRRRVWRGAEKVSGGEAAGEILAAATPTGARDSKLFHIAFAGGKDGASWTDFMRSIPGEPKWVVADKEQGISDAVSRVWPNAIFYQCEMHLRRNAETALEKDGVPFFKYATNPLYEALRSAQWSPATWEAFVERVEADIPPELISTRSWIAANKALILGQMSVRAANPGRPLANGAIEAELEKIKARLKYRTGPMRNFWRFNLLLELMCAEAAGVASIAKYTLALRTHFAARGGLAPTDWTRARDEGGARSLDDFLTASLLRARANISGANAAGKTKRYAADLATRNADRAAGGLDPIRPGRRLRPDGSRHDTRVEVVGKTVADFKQLVDEWDPIENGDLRPEDVKAGSTRPNSLALPEGTPLEGQRRIAGEGHNQLPVLHEPQGRP